MEPVKKVESITIRPLEFQVGSYHVKIALDHDRIAIRAYSEISAKLFEGMFDTKDLTEQERFVFEDCEAVFVMMEDCIIDKRKVELSDVGELKFPYFFQPNRRSQVEKIFEVKLKEV